MKYIETTELELDGVDDLPDQIRRELEEQLFDNLTCMFSSSDGNVTISLVLTPSVKAFSMKEILRDDIQSCWDVANDESIKEMDTYIKCFSELAEICRKHKKRLIAAH